MAFLFRGKNTPVEPDPTLLRLQEERRLAEMSVERLQVARRTMSERLATMLGERQSRTISLEGLRRLTLYRTAIDIGGVLIDEAPQDASGQTRTNFDVSDEGKSLVIARHEKGQDEQWYRFVQSQKGVFLDKKDGQEALSSPLAQKGLERLEEICTHLGSFSLVDVH